MAKMTLEHGKTRISINGDNNLIERERTAFYNFVRSLPSVSSDERIQDKGREPESGRKSVPSWAEMKQAADEGRLSELVKSGDRLPLVLKNGERIDLDVGRDERGRTYFIFHYLMSAPHPMNFECTNEGSWRDCEMRRYANDEVYNLLPEEVKAVIVPTRITQVIGGERIETHDKLFCLSDTQVFGDSEYGNKQEPEDTQIDIFRDPPARIKQAVGKATASSWWLRSAPGRHNTFYYVNSSGYNGYDIADYSDGVALGFCIEDD